MNNKVDRSYAHVLNTQQADVLFPSLSSRSTSALEHFSLKQQKIFFFLASKE